MKYNLEETKRKEKAKFSKVNGNIKIRYPIYRRGSDLVYTSIFVRRQLTLSRVCFS